MKTNYGGATHYNSRFGYNDLCCPSVTASTFVVNSKCNFVWTIIHISVGGVKFARSGAIPKIPHAGYNLRTVGHISLIFENQLGIATEILRNLPQNFKTALWLLLNSYADASINCLSIGKCNFYRYVAIGISEWPFYFSYGIAAAQRYYLAAICLPTDIGNRLGAEVNCKSDDTFLTNEQAIFFANAFNRQFAVFINAIIQASGFRILAKGNAALGEGSR